MNFITRRSCIVWLLLAAAVGCGSGVPKSDPQAARKLLEQTLQAWKEGKKPEDLKQQSIFVGDTRWESGAKLAEFTITSDGEDHQSSQRIPVRMKLSSDAKAKEAFYWVTTSPAQTVTLAD